MIEFRVPREHHIAPSRDPEDLFPLTVGIVGDLAAQVVREGLSSTIVESAKQDLRFSAFFFDAFLNGTPEFQATSYVTILAAAAYYLCDLPGSSAVLSSRISQESFEQGCAGLDETLAWYLQGRFVASVQIENEIYSDLVRDATEAMRTFYQIGVPEAAILQPLREVREKAYQLGNPRHILLADLIFAIAKRRLEVSSRTCLPQFTQVESAAWESTLSKPTFVREFWPAQRLLGAQGVFRGRSAVVQMPTSAGKTRATEILIRSAFLSKRTGLVVVVAPFRALCHEIRDNMILSFRQEDVLIDELSDVPQSDFDLGSEPGPPRVLILTPEKLLYILRQTPELAPAIGLLIYDEGHQFDSGVRGISYELLVTSLKKVVPSTCQVVLISAVITNADAINTWLNADDGIVVSGTDLHPTLRSVAFASWTDTLGRIEFLGQPDSGDYAYFVPRILERTLLQKLSQRERNPRYFPVREDGQSVALYLALKLVAEGAVAIFCGLKASVASVCSKLVAAYERGLSLASPLGVSDAEEVRKLARLIKRHLGEGNPTAKCADLGVFTHHGSTPAGIRLAVEHAMKESLVRMVVCTSTLAQGVNLPIRYLIVTSIYQGAERISVRDFQNLMGRAGRSGMHTEGSVIFADPETYDLRRTREGRWRWARVEELFDPSNAQACASSLLTLFEPLHSDDGSATAALNVRVFFESYLKNQAGLPAFAGRLARDIGHGFSPSNLASQLQPRGKIIEALESYMMSASSEDNSELDEDRIVNLARETLAYHLANPAQRSDLEQLFRAISKHIIEKVPAPITRKAYSKSLLGVTNSLAIHEWVMSNKDSLIATPTDEELLQALWPMIVLGVSNSLFVRCTKPGLLLELAMKWISEQTPAQILDFLSESDVRFGEGKRPRYATIDHAVDLCENALAFEGVLVLAAVCESLRLEAVEEALIDRIGRLQKRLKYGLNSAAAITLHELGFADRVVARDLADLLNVRGSGKRPIRRRLQTKRQQVEDLLETFPAYFRFVVNNI